MHKNKKRQSVIAILLVAVVLIGGAFAFLTAQDSKTNVFTVGKIDIELLEKFDTDFSGIIDTDETYDSTHQTVNMDKGVRIVPNDTVLKQPFVKNTGNNDAWIFMTVAVPTAVKTGDIISAENVDANPQINIKAYAIQDGYNGTDNDSAAEVWADYFDNATTFGEEVDAEAQAARAELFSLNNVNTDNWTQIGTVYHAANVDYYVYAYKVMLAPSVSTPNLFTSVTLSSSIVNA